MRKREHYQGQRGKVLVQRGIDIKRQILGSEKGYCFTGKVDNEQTVLVKGANAMVWKISFQNLTNREVYKCRFQGKMIIGRAQADPQCECLILPQDMKISKVHCILYEAEGVLWLADMNSRNHTWLNGVQVQDKVRLKNGDVMKIGDTQLRVEYGR